MKAWVRKLFEDAQGIPDEMRVLSFLLVLAYVANSIYAVYDGQDWDPQAFGIGAGALAGGVGALFGLRREY